MVSCTRIAMVIDSITANEQVLNRVGIEQSQKLFEVGW